MRSLLILALGLFLGSASPLAHASTITPLDSSGGGGDGGGGGCADCPGAGTTLYVSALLTYGVTVYGTFQYTATGQYIGDANLTVYAGADSQVVAAGSESQVFNYSDANYTCDASGLCEFRFSGFGSKILDLYLNQSALTGEPLNSETSLGNSTLLSGSVSTSPLPPPVPEPSSIILLGTGLVSAIGLVRRQRA